MKFKIFFSLTTVLAITVHVFGQTTFWDSANIREGTRYEGFQPQNVSAAFKLLAFHKFRLDSYKAGDKIKILFYKPEPGFVEINANPIKQNSNYRMSVIQNKWGKGWLSYEPWSVDVVLLKNDIQANNLGVKIQDSSEVYFPASILKLENSPPIDSIYKVYFFTPAEIESIEYKVISGEKIVVYQGSKDEIPPESSFNIRFELPNNLESSFYDLLLKISYANGNLSEKSYSFFHKQP
jgi:hypothetical protein